MADIVDKFGGQVALLTRERSNDYFVSEQLWQRGRIDEIGRRVSRVEEYSGWVDCLESLPDPAIAAFHSGPIAPIPLQDFGAQICEPKSARRRNYGRSTQRIGFSHQNSHVNGEVPDRFSARPQRQTSLRERSEKSDRPFPNGFR